MKAPYYASQRAVALLDRSRSRRAKLITGVLAVIAALILGVWLMPTPDGLLARADGVRVLGRPLESAFALSTILALIVCFRTWERMFPTTIPSIYTLYPLRSSAIVGRELKALASDALFILAVACAYQLPSWIVLRAPQVGYAVFYALLSTGVIAATAYGVPTIFVRSALRSTDSTPKISASQVAANIASAASLGVTVSVLLLLKLGVEEFALALNLDAFVPALVRNFRAQEAWMTKSAAVALLVPLAASIGVLLMGVFLRLRHWLSDSMRVAAAMVFTPELSYAWIDAQAQSSGPANPHRLLHRRDVVRVQRAAPFRPWLVGGASLLTSATLLLAAPLTRWVSLLIFASWVLVWMRLPARVAQTWTRALWDWDFLLVDAKIIRRARATTMARVLAPYAFFLIFPTLAYGIAYKDWLPSIFTAACCVALSAHAVYLLRRQDDV